MVKGYNTTGALLDDMDFLWFKMHCIWLVLPKSEQLSGEWGGGAQEKNCIHEIDETWAIS